METCVKYKILLLCSSWLDTLFYSRRSERSNNVSTKRHAEKWTSCWGEPRVNVLWNYRVWCHTSRWDLVDPQWVPTKGQVQLDVSERGRVWIYISCRNYFRSFQLYLIECGRDSDRLWQTSYREGPQNIKITRSSHWTSCNSKIKGNSS